MSTVAMPGRAAGAPLVRRILLGSWQQRWNRDERWGIWLLLGQPLLALGALWWGPAIAAAVFCGLLAGSLVGAWASVVSNVLEQNQPAAAHLVPGHPNALRASLTIAAAATVSAVTLVGAGMVLSLRHTALAPALEGWPAGWPAALLAVASGVVLVIALFVRWPGLVWAAVFLPGLAVWHDGSLFALAGRVVAQAWLAEPGLVAVASLALSLWLPGVLVQRGGALHARGYARRQAARERFRRRALGLEPASADACGRLDMVGRSRLGAWQWLLRRALARPRRGVGELMLALGPAGHWSTLVGKVGAMLLMTAVVLGVISLFGPADLPLSAVSGMSYGVMFLAITPVLQMRARYHQAGVGQSLLVLAPGVPRGATLARALAWRTTVEFAVGWLALYALARGLVAMQHQLIAAGMAAGTRVAYADGAVHVIAIAVIPLAAFAWRRLDRLPPPRQSAVLGDVAVGGLSVAGVTLLWRGLHLPLPAVAALWLLATAAWCAMRWRAMAHEPAPLPTGRHRA